MSTITTRAGKGSPLTNTELDANFTNLNADKLELGGTYSSGTANGVAYLNGSKVLTTGSALTFDGYSLGVTNPSAFGGQATFTQTASAAGVASIKVQSSTASIDLMSGGASYGVNYMDADEAGLITQGADGMRFNIGGSYARWTFGGSEQMRLTSTGLGIGTSSPSAKLHVVSSASYSGALIQGGTTTDAAVLTLQNSNGNGKYSFGVYGSANPSGPQPNSFYIYDGVAAQVRLTLSTSGNLGLGVTPSAWGYYKAAQVGYGSLASTSGNDTVVFSNAYYDSTNYRYLASSYASQYRQVNGAHVWYTAPSGTAGNPISFTQAMTLDASGNLIVSNTNAGSGVSGNITNLSSAAGSQAELRVTQGSVATVVNSYNNTNAYIGTISNHPVAFLTNNTERMRIDSSGNVGIGTSSPSYRLDVRKAGETNIGIVNTTNSVSTLIGSATDTAYIGTFTNHPQTFYTNSTERMRIDSSGAVRVNNSSGNYGQFTSRTATAGTPAMWAWSNFSGDVGYPAMRFDKYDNNSTTSQVFVNFSINNNTTANGQINANGASQAAFGNWSDIRLKENVENLPSQLNKVCELRPVEFDYKDGSGHQIGFIAQEMQEVYPDAVGERVDGMLTITGWNKTEARLVKAIQELKAELDATKAEVAALKQGV